MHEGNRPAVFKRLERSVYLVLAGWSIPRQGRAQKIARCFIRVFNGELRMNVHGRTDGNDAREFEHVVVLQANAAVGDVLAD